MKTRTITGLALAAAAGGLASVLLIQFSTGGSNPPLWAMFAALFLLGAGAQLAARLQVLHPVLRLLPLLAAAAWGFWGTWLYCTSAHWVNATLSDLLAGYWAPAVGALAALILWRALLSEKC